MNVIGLRATPKKIYFSIIEFREEDFRLVNESVVVPVSFDLPQKLKYVRRTLLDIFNEYNIEKAGIRTAEPISRNFDLFRLMLEAVIQEMIASSKVRGYFIGPKATLTSKLGLPNNGTLTSQITGEEIYKYIEDRALFSTEHRESILAAHAAFNL